MFLDQLNDDQKRSFLALATRMILADGDLAPEEDGDLDKIRNTLGDDIVALPEEVFGATNAAVFGDRASRIITVFEILLLAFSDKHLHADESTVLQEICRALDINEDEKARFSELAERYISNPGDGTIRAEVETIIAAG